MASYQSNAHGLGSIVCDEALFSTGNYSFFVFGVKTCGFTCHFYATDTAETIIPNIGCLSEISCLLLLYLLF